MSIHYINSVLKQHVESTELEEQLSTNVTRLLKHNCDLRWPGSKYRNNLLIEVDTLNIDDTVKCRITGSVGVPRGLDVRQVLRLAALYASRSAKINYELDLEGLLITTIIETQPDLYVQQY